MPKGTCAVPSSLSHVRESSTWTHPSPFFRPSQFCESQRRGTTRERASLRGDLTLTTCERGKIYLQIGNMSTRKAPGTIARLTVVMARCATTKCLSVSDLILIPYMVMSMIDAVRLDYGEHRTLSQRSQARRSTTHNLACPKKPLGFSTKRYKNSWTERYWKPSNFLASFVFRNWWKKRRCTLDTAPKAIRGRHQSTPILTIAISDPFAECNKGGSHSSLTIGALG